MAQPQPKNPFTVEQRSGKLTVSSGSVWEPKIGYSRAIKKGNMILSAVAWVLRRTKPSHRMSPNRRDGRWRLSNRLWKLWGLP